MSGRSIDVDSGRRTGLALGLVVVFSVLAVAVVAAAGPSDDLDFEADDPAPNPYMSAEDITVAKHPMTEGTAASDMAGYFDDSGDWVSDPVWEVNTTEDQSVQSTMNKYVYDPAKVDDGDWAEFPRTNDEEGDNDASILDASEWNSVSGDTSQSDTTIASGVAAVQLATNGSMAASNVIEMGYANWTSSYDSDESKRVLQVAGEVNSMDSGASVNVSLEDEDGDRKTVMIEPDASQDTNASVAYGQTSGTFFYQIKLSAVPFDDGSGTWSNIESVNVTMVDADADISFSRIGFVVKSKYELGKRAVDDATDDDSDFDQRNSTYNATGTISVHDLGTLDASFDDASLIDVQFPIHATAGLLNGEMGEEETYVYNFRDAESYPNYEKVLNATYRMELPAAIDLSYGTNDLKLEQQYPSGRYLELGNAEDISDTKNLSQASWDDDTGALGEVGDIIKLDDSVTSDEYHAVHYEVKLTSVEVDDVMDTAADAGGGGQFANDSGGSFLDDILGIPGMIVGSILVALGLKKREGA